MTAKRIEIGHGRLIVDPPQPGDWNMAVDEALLQSAAEGNTTLRFYQWSAPTLSLGYFQARADRHQHAASRDCPCVRRSSGGGAILHHLELTYSLAMPASGRGRGLERVYDMVHEALVRALSQVGVQARLRPPVDTPAEDAIPPFLCFLRRARGDVLVGDHKICGSAQRRVRGALLQHGSVILQTSPYAPEIAGMEPLAGRLVDTGELARLWTAEIAAASQVTWSPGELSAAQRKLAERVRSDRFAAAGWLSRR